MWENSRISLLRYLILVIGEKRRKMFMEERYSLLIRQPTHSEPDSLSSFNAISIRENPRELS